MKPTRCTNFSNLFCNKILHVSDSYSVHHQEFFTEHTGIVYVIQVCRQLAGRIRMERSYIVIPLLESCLQTCMTYTIPECTVNNSWWWTEELSETRSVSVPSWSCSKAVYKHVWHIPLLCVQWKTPDDGQRNCPKHSVSFQNKFEKLVHLVGFIIRICHDARQHERKICQVPSPNL
jgi:hypothetical protein